MERETGLQQNCHGYAVCKTGRLVYNKNIMVEKGRTYGYFYRRTCICIIRFLHPDRRIQRGQNLESVRAAKKEQRQEPSGFLPFSYQLFAWDWVSPGSITLPMP
ncbi:hypothetical protein ACTID9_05020 [Brevibacillus fluminis]|uniref:hypothetical protein n=1 Tax=Brevibacillus fluminis TaxID=511487 RepID=UPI003F893F0A